MKLACLRCKRKKIKCDKSEPICHQCVTAKADCQYVERRQRPKMAQQRVAVHHLSQRLEFLEKHISRGGSESSPPASRPNCDPEPLSESTPSSDPVPSPKVSLLTGDGQDSWIYRMASDVRRNFQSQTTPVSTPTPRIDDAMSSLNDALDELGRLRIRTDACKLDLNISLEEARASIDAFVNLMNNMVVPDVLVGPIDVDLLRMMPNIVKSPYINVEPGVYVMYYNALYFGLHQIRGPDPVAQGMYLKLLEAVPAWLDAAADTEMDGHTAALTAWTAINNHDYQLSWKFHCKSCHYIKTRKIDQIDVIPARTFEEESKRDSMRFLYWHILSTDILFRLFYGKPTVVRWMPNKVRPPAVIRSDNMQPSISQVTVFVVWMRYTTSTAEMLNEIDACPPHSREEPIQQKVDEFCLKLEDLMVEWRLEAIMADESKDEVLRYLIADHVMNMYAIIIGMKRLVSTRSASSPVDAISLRAARQVAQITLDFSIRSADLSQTTQYVCIHFISFYPFCAVFSLYEYILACNSPEDCEQDVQVLERLGATMEEASALRKDFVPLSRTINALNKVSRTVQDERRKAAAVRSDPATSETANIAAPEFDFSAFASFPEFPFSFDDNAQPLGFVRALENDFTGRNWNEGWWDAGENPMAGLHETGNGQHPGYMPTPNTG